MTMCLRRKYTPIYKNATALLRPKTGLNDMILELTPGPEAGKAPLRWTIPVAQTQANVNFDEVLSSLDGDTRDYLQLLIAAGGQGLDGQGKNLSKALKRFEPTGRYLAELNGALAKRDVNIRRSIHNFRLLAVALGNKDDQLAQLVDSSNASSRRSPTRTSACASRSACCPARCRDEHRAGQGQPDGQGPRARRWAPCAPAPARSGRR